MKKIVVLLLVGLLPVLAFAGTINGTVRYTGSMVGTILVAFLEEGSTSIDPFSTPYTTITTPGAFTITSASLIDGVNYYGIAYMGTGLLFPMPASGNPAGMTPTPTVLSGGVASGVIIDITETGTIGGVITYGGDITDVFMNVYDIFPEFMGGSAVLENTYYIGASNYRINNVPSGAKRIEAFADINGNHILDEIEPSAIFEGPFGEVVFVGGGSPAESMVDITIPGTGIADSRLPSKPRILVSPNPFNSACAIEIFAENEILGNVEILDITGKSIKTIELTSNKAIWDGMDNNGSPQPSGTYFISFGKCRTVPIVLIK